MNRTEQRTGTGRYSPPASIWEKSDAELLETMLTFYPHREPDRILDATMNCGRFWRGSSRAVIGIDVNPQYHPHIVADNRQLPFGDEFFDVVVYDPPHLPNYGRDGVKDFSTRFGLVLKSDASTEYDLKHLYSPFTCEAFRVLRQDGILFCKVTDYVHNHRTHWAHIDLHLAAVSSGFCPCDLIIKIRRGPIVDPKWKVAHHAKRRYAFWLVFRKAENCE